MLSVGRSPFLAATPSPVAAGHSSPVAITHHLRHEHRDIYRCIASERDDHDRADDLADEATAENAKNRIAWALFALAVLFLLVVLGSIAILAHWRGGYLRLAPGSVSAAASRRGSATRIAAPAPLPGSPTVSRMSVETEEELAALRAAGKVVADALVQMRAAVKPGVTTAALDAVAGEVFERAGARSGPKLDYGFPGVTCISVNDETVHGIPGPRKLTDGDLVKLDVTAELDGYYADACITVSAGRALSEDMPLVETARRALANAMRIARAGARLNEIGAAVEKTASSRGFSVCTDLMGHGIGRRIHEPPDVPNYYRPDLDQRLPEGLVLTIEPIIAAGRGSVRPAGDGWMLRTADGSRAAHVEHTIVIQEGAPIVITA
jgi:methionyl aminopeptidase